MHVKVRFFASAREVVGESSIGLEVTEGLTSDVLMEQLCERYPRLLGSRATISLAINRVYIKGSEVVTLKEGDEIALLPPISGG